MAAASAVAFAAEPPASGTELSGTLANDLNSKTASVGEGFILHNVTTTNGDGSVVGAKIYGHVAEVEHGGQGRKPGMELAFDRLVLTDGTSYEMSGKVESVQQKTRPNTVREIGGAVVGNIVGNYLGKHIGGAAATLGGAVGAAGGYLYAKNYRENFTIPANSLMTLTVSRTRRQT
jgi:hypothetical protein